MCLYFHWSKNSKQIELLQTVKFELFHTVWLLFSTWQLTAEQFRKSPTSLPSLQCFQLTLSLSLSSLDFERMLNKFELKTSPFIVAGTHQTTVIQHAQRVGLRPTRGDPMLLYSQSVVQSSLKHTLNGHYLNRKLQFDKPTLASWQLGCCLK